MIFFYARHTWLVCEQGPTALLFLNLLPPTPYLPLVLSTSWSASFWQLFIFQATFPFKQRFAFWAFWEIRAAFSVTLVLPHSEDFRSFFEWFPEDQTNVSEFVGRFPKLAKDFWGRPNLISTTFGSVNMKILQIHQQTGLHRYLHMQKILHLVLCKFKYTDDFSQRGKTWLYTLVYKERRLRAYFHRVIDIF